MLARTGAEIVVWIGSLFVLAPSNVLAPALVAKGARCVRCGRPL
jgi:hypothetical protein